MPAARRARTPFRAASARAGLALLLSLPLLGPAPAPAGEPAPAGSSRDLRLTLHVRSALLKDPVLGPLNLWVRVRQNVATLSGDVPSEAVGRRAVELAGRVHGVAEVRNELRVAPRDGLPDGPVAFPQGPPPDPDDRPTTPGGLTHQPRRRQVPQKAQVAGPEQRPAWDTITLGRPVPGGPTPTPARPSAPAELLPPRPLPPASAPTPPDLGRAVAALCQGDDRFRQLRPEVERGVVYLRGAVARWEDAHELAAVVRRLPGVEAVILDNLRLDRFGAAPVRPR